MEKIMRWALLVLALVVTSCGPRGPGVGVSKGDPLDDESATRNFREQAKKLVDASMAEDFDRASALTHPKLVEKYGGKDRYISLVKSVMADTKNGGAEVIKVTLGDSVSLARAGDELFGTIPQSTHMSFNKTKGGVQPSFLVGHSTDGGRNWVFFDGAGLDGDRTKMRQLIPNFPDSLDLPKKQQLVMLID